MSEKITDELVVAAFKASIASRLGLPATELFGRSLTLSQVLSRSPMQINSIDIMEAVAVAMAEQGLEDRIELPVFTLEDSVDEVMEKIVSQLK